MEGLLNLIGTAAKAVPGVSKAMQLGGKISKHAARAIQIAKYASRAKKEIDRLEGLGFKTSNKLRQFANQEVDMSKRYSARDVQVAHDISLLSSIRMNAKFDFTVKTSVADVGSHGKLTADRNDIRNKRDVDFHRSISYANPGRELRRVIVGALRNGPFKRDAANEAISMIENLSKAAGMQTYFGDRIFDDDFIKNFKDHVPTANELTRLIKAVESNPNTELNPYKVVAAISQKFSSEYGTTRSEAAGKYEQIMRKADDTLKLNRNLGGIETSNEDIREFRNFLSDIPSEAWEHYKEIWESNGIVNLIFYTNKSSKEIFLPEIKETLKSCVIREENPKDIQERIDRYLDMVKTIRENVPPIKE